MNLFLLKFRRSYLHLLFLIVFFFSFSLHADSKNKTIGIFTFSVQGMPEWDPDSTKSGITGSEEAVIYISEKLAKKGYTVLVFGNPPKNSAYSKENSNPRFVPFNYPFPSKLDIAISWRAPLMASTLKQKALKVYLWPHDTYHWPVPKNEIDQFEDVLWLSRWQREQWISVNPGFEKFKHFYGNGVNLEQFETVQDRSNPYSCIYGSNYARGLAILLNIWPDIKERFPKATLDIYYGWQHWGLMTKEQEAAMRQQVKNWEKLNVVEHGLVGHEELNRAYAKASFWTYPCTAPECFAITALRAQASGAIPVIIDGTALKETVRNGYKCANASEYLQTLTKAMLKAETITLEQRKRMKNFISEEFTWDKVADKWIETFEQ
jgi:glycosyltransferase involved in cell wall biosynthesis